MPGFPDDILRDIGSAFAPLETALTNANELSSLMARFGWTFDPAATGGMNAFQQNLGGIVNSITAVVADVSTNDLNQLAQDLPKLVSELQPPLGRF
jgi:hypothetical protein